MQRLAGSFDAIRRNVCGDEDGTAGNLVLPARRFAFIQPCLLQYAGNAPGHVTRRLGETRGQGPIGHDRPDPGHDERDS
jgi:hypothetical protein